MVSGSEFRGGERLKREGKGKERGGRVGGWASRLIMNGIGWCPMSYLHHDGDDGGEHGHGDDRTHPHGQQARRVARVICWS